MRVVTPFHGRSRSVTISRAHIPDKIERASFNDLHVKRAHLVILEPLRNATLGYQRQELREGVRLPHPLSKFHDQLLANRGVRNGSHDSGKASISIGFPAHFRHLFIQLTKCASNFVPDILESANWSINFKHRHSISCFVTHFRQLQFKFVRNSIAEHETANSNSSIGNQRKRERKKKKK